MQPINGSKKCFIFGALPVNEMPLAPSKNDIVIAADKGILNTENLGIRADLIIGDFDSLGHIPNRDNTIVLPVKKDLTDIGFAIDLAMGSNTRNISEAEIPKGVAIPDFAGIDTVVVYGGIGGMLDHTLANLQLASRISRLNANPLFFGEGVTVTAIHNSGVIFPPSLGRISVFCSGGEAHGVTIKNLEYELTDATLYPDNPLGVSNAFTDNFSEITVKDGTLIIVWQSKVLPSFRKN